MLISLLVLGSVSTQLALFHVYGYRAVRNLAEQNLSQVHDRIADRMRDYFEIAERVSRVNRKTIEMGHWDRHDLASWRDAFYEQMRGFDTVSSILWGDVFGGAVFVSRYPGENGYRFGVRVPAVDPRASEFRLFDDGRLADVPTAIYEYDPRNRPWYQTAIAAGEPAWGGIYTWVPKAGMVPVLSVPFVAPVYGRSGEMLGVFDVEISLHDLGDFLRTLAIGRTGVAYVMDHDGLLVATSAGVPVVEGATGQRLPATASGHPLIATSAARVSDRLTREADTPQRFSDTFEVGGAEVMLMAAPFSRFGHLRWLAVTLVPADDFLAPIKSGRGQGLLIAALTVAVSLGLGILIALFVARPIEALSDHVRRIGGGNLDAEIRLTEFPEFVRLSDAINRMVEGLRERLHLRKSLALAMEVQQRLLPLHTPEYFGLEIAGHSDYCEETGGDYFDYLELRARPADIAVVAIGDVSGHGVAAAMIMASARAVLRSRGRDTDSLAELLGHMNRQITEDVGGGRFMTMLLLAINVRQRTLRWACAGHREPLLLQPGAAAFTQLEGAGIPLGIDADAQYQEHRFDDLRAGQILLLATDGLWEAKDPDGQKLGLDRLVAVIRDNSHLPAAAIRERVAAAEQAFRGGRPQSDDISFVVIKVTDTGSA
ncbi:MAG: SpoIIE family protein phosphatase [Gammaproteobacteria bacterium]|nr:SpoIIE family protein phosphatase [Gammaproteobacteria bacterium]